MPRYQAKARLDRIMLASGMKIDKQEDEKHTSTKDQNDNIDEQIEEKIKESDDKNKENQTAGEKDDYTNKEENRSVVEKNEEEKQVAEKKSEDKNEIAKETIEEENQPAFEENDDKIKENQTDEEKNDEKVEKSNEFTTEKCEEKKEDKNQPIIERDEEKDKNSNENEETDINKEIVPSDEDFSSGSSDDYIPNSESDSSSENCPPMKRNRVPVTIYESCDTSSLSELSNTELLEGIISEREEEEQIVEIFEDNLEDPGTSGNKTGRKVRQSLKERREDRSLRLFLRNSGKTYVTKLGKVRKGRNFVPLTSCRMKCRDRITHDVRENVFKEYWNLGSYDERAKYVARFVTLKNKKSGKIGAKRKRENTMYYKLVNFADEYKICKGCLLKTLGETNRFLQTICEKLKKYGHVTKSMRGRAASYKKMSQARLKIVEDHIKKFPAYESHYSRSKTSKKYLSADLTLETMYRLYAIENDDPVCKIVYSKVFKDLHLSFKKPSVDTCNKCNLLQNKLKYLTDDDEVHAVQQQLKQHQVDYESAYNEKRLDKIIAKSNSETCVIAFDLQQLSTQSDFYKRQLWVFNLTIHDLETDNAYCYMWPESSGGRGANQIASCLYDFITVRLPLLHPTSKYLIMYSDSCSGQNKNSIVTTALMIALKDSTQLLTINHKFLIPGHTHMEVDSDHALIEKAKKRTSMNIHHPRDWCQLVRTASNRTNKFSVIEMNSNDFYDFAKFTKQHLLVKKNNSIGQKFTWTDIRIMKFVNNQFPQFTYKTCFEDQNFYSMSYAKRSKDYEFVTINTVEKCYSGPNPISKQKKRDLISLLEYIDPGVHDFYHQLLTNEDLHDVDPDLASNEDEYI